MNFEYRVAVYPPSLTTERRGVAIVRHPGVVGGGQEVLTDAGWRPIREEEIPAPLLARVVFVAGDDPLRRAPDSDTATAAERIVELTLTAQTLIQGYHKALRHDALSWSQCGEPVCSMARTILADNRIKG